MTIESNETFIYFSWDEVNCSQRNGDIDSYAITYEDLQRNSTTNRIVQELEVVLDGLMPSTIYRISLAAFNRNTGMGPFNNFSVKTTDFITTESE